VSSVKSAEAKSMKVVVDLIIEAMSINNIYFNQSSDPQCTTPSGGNMCNFFMWINNNATQEGTWESNSVRQQKYEVRSTDKSSAFINYDSPQAVKYLVDLVGAWIDRGANGVHLRDVGAIRNNSLDTLVQKVWKSKFEGQNKTRALFVYSASMSQPPAHTDQSVNGSNTDPDSVLVNGGDAGHVMVEDVGSKP